MRLTKCQLVLFHTRISLDGLTMGRAVFKGAFSGKIYVGWAFCDCFGNGWACTSYERFQDIVGAASARLPLYHRDSRFDSLPLIFSDDKIGCPSDCWTTDDWPRETGLIGAQTHET